MRHLFSNSIFLAFILDSSRSGCFQYKVTLITSMMCSYNYYVPAKQFINVMVCTSQILGCFAIIQINYLATYTALNKGSRNFNMKLSWKVFWFWFPIFILQVSTCIVKPVSKIHMPYFFNTVRKSLNNLLFARVSGYRYRMVNKLIISSSQPHHPFQFLLQFH